jgi:hypothetical protein
MDAAIDSRVNCLLPLTQEGVLDDQQREALQVVLAVVRRTPVEQVDKAAAQQHLIAEKFYQ